MLKPVILGVALGTAVPFIYVAGYFLMERKRQLGAELEGGKRWFTFEPRRIFVDGQGNLVSDGSYVNFKPILGHYLKVAEVLITLSSASLVFIPNLHLSSGLPWLGMPLVLLGFTVVFALAFMGLITYFYSTFQKDPRTYTRFRAAINHGLAFGGLTTFALAYFFIAIILGSAVSNGTLVTPLH